MASVRNQKRQNMGGKSRKTATAAPSPGSRLRQAREALGMEVASLAQQLHLSKVMVQALEEENYDVLPARVFVRGYYRNYARLVNVPEEVVLSDFEKRCPEGEDCSAPPAVAQGVKKEIRSSHGLVRLVSWLVVIALVTTFGLWWKSNLDKEVPVVAKDDASVAETAAPVFKQDASKAEADVGNDTEAQPDVAATIIAGQSVNAPAAEPPAQDGQVQASAREENTPAGPETAVQETEHATAETEPEPVPAEILSPRVVLSFKGDCWIDVRGANRSFKIVGKRKAGEEIELGGEAPYRMVLGNARNVDVLINGKPYDLTPHTRGNVAKLTLNPKAE
ncbi:RodZ domain-containing protein [Thiolapillus sp.]